MTMYLGDGIEFRPLIDEPEAVITQYRHHYSISIHHGLMDTQRWGTAWTQRGAERKAARMLKRYLRSLPRERTTVNLRDADDLQSALMDHLYAALDNCPKADRPRAVWVMNQEWWDEIERIRRGFSLLSPVDDIPVLLYGKPVVIREDGGVPHLVVADA